MLRHFYCPQCHSTQTVQGVAQRCEKCGSCLVARYEYTPDSSRLAKQDLMTRAKSIWRYRELLPVLDESNIVSLGEGGSPVTALDSTAKEFGLARLYLKDDSVMPLGSFRTRLASVCISKAREENISTVIAHCTPNEALAFSAYAGRAGIEAVMVVDATEITAGIEEAILGAGAVLYKSNGRPADAQSLVERTAREHGWLNLTQYHTPYRLEGAKTIGLEIAEAFEWRMPEVIILPGKGGGALTGVYRAIRDLQALGWISTMPRLVAVQPEGKAVLVEAWRNKRLSMPINEEDDAIQFGESVEFAMQREYLALDAIYKSLGVAVAVSPDELRKAGSFLMRHEGVLPSVYGAATVAAAQKLRAEGWIKPADRVLVYDPENTVAAGKLLAAENDRQALVAPLSNGSVLPKPHYHQPITPTD